MDMDMVSIVDKKGNALDIDFDNGKFIVELAAQTDYTLKVGIGDGDNVSMSYIVAIS